ncbi:MAG: hypothetical protein EXS13_04950 [Planctomycetes bacterium]|nr:hypothetical protein [Planctomycetota bacterium]
MLIRLAGIASCVSRVSRESRRRAVAAFALLVAPLLAVGCASGGASSAEECGTGLDRPHFGDAATGLWGQVAALPDDSSNEWSDRTARVGNSFDRFFSARGREWDLTSARVASLPSWLGDECVDNRSPRLFGFLGRQGQRIVDDSCCFPTRAWHSIKLAIE